MSFLLIHADRALSVAVDDPIVPAPSVPALHDALALLDRAGRLHEDAERRDRDGYDAGRRAGEAAGTQAAHDAGAAEWRAELFKLALRDSEARAKMRAEVATLAIEVVRRIAGEIGAPAMLAGIAERACAELVPDTVATVRVPEAATALATERLAGLSSVTVVADATLPSNDCIVETALGTSHAGLETQLAQLEAAWREVRHG